MGIVYEFPVVTGFSENPPFHGPTTEENITLIHNNGLILMDNGQLYTAIGSSVSGVKAAFWIENGRLQRVEKQGPINQYRCYSQHAWPYDVFLESLELTYYTNDTFLYASSELLTNVRIDLFEDKESAENAIGVGVLYPITYRLTNCTAPSAPAEATIGDTVNVPLVMQEGYDIVTPSTDILVTNNGVTVPHTYNNGTISFTMPDPS